MSYQTTKLELDNVRLQRDRMLQEILDAAGVSVAQVDDGNLGDVLKAAEGKIPGVVRAFHTLCYKAEVLKGLAVDGPGAQ